MICPQETKVVYFAKIPHQTEYYLRRALSMSTELVVDQYWLSRAVNVAGILAFILILRGSVLYSRQAIN